MTIIFNEITSDIRTNTHHIEVDSSRARQASPAIPNKILVMGIKLAAGTVAELVPKNVLSADQAEGYFGVGSQLWDTVRTAKLNNPNAEMVAIAIDELTGGTAGTTTLSVTGTTTAAGTLPLYIGGEYFAIALASGDDATAIAAAIDTQLKAHTKYSRIAFTSSAAIGVVTLTMRWKGVEQPDVRFNYQSSDVFVPGITSIVVAEGVAGAGNPDVSEIVTVMGDIRYDTIICPWGDATNLGLIEAEGLRRWGPMVQAEGHIFAGHVGTHGTATTLGNSRNSKHLTAMAGNESPSPSWRWAAATGSIDSAEAHPARPRQTLQLKGVLPAAQTAEWTRAQRDLLLHDGISTHTVDQGGNVYVERLITTYQTNALAVSDTAFLNVCTMRTLMAIRYSRRLAISLDFPRHLVMSDTDAIPPGLPVVTPNIIKAHGIAQFLEWQKAGWVEDYAQFAEEYLTERDPADDNRIIERMGPNLMNQFRGLSGQIQFLS